MEEWFVLEASKKLNCSFIELWDHPQRHSLMSAAFTVDKGVEMAKEVWKAQAEQQEKLKNAEI